MSNYFFDWKIFVTDELLTRLGSLAGLTDPIASLHPQLEPLVAQLLSVLGRLNVAPRVYSESERTTIALQMLEDAIRHVFAPSARRTLPGYTVNDGAPAQPPIVTHFDRVPLNRASVSEIAGLPGISTAIATRIVSQRRVGPFRSIKDLDVRVVGIGPVLSEQIRPSVTLDLPSTVVSINASGDFDRDWPMLVNQQVGPDPLTRVLQALELLLLQVRAHPQPGPVDLSDALHETAADALHPLEEVEVLFSSRYHTRVVELLTAAVSQIEISMFHIALPDPKHPTSKLLSAVKEAHERGVAVRVMVDSDRQEDPYLSTVINQPAVDYLRAAGVPVRQDTPDKLLHSKCVVIDDDLVLIGSHNWTAGSYYQFDDLTLAIRSASLVAQQRQRFDALWAAASDVH